MNTADSQTTEETMVAQLFADFEAGLSSARLEHALARLAPARSHDDQTTSQGAGLSKPPAPLTNGDQEAGR